MGSCTLERKKEILFFLFKEQQAPKHPSTRLQKCIVFYTSSTSAGACWAAIRRPPGHRAPGTKHQAPGTGHRAPAPSTKHRAPGTGHRPHSGRATEPRHGTAHFASVSPSLGGKSPHSRSHAASPRLARTHDTHGTHDTNRNRNRFPGRGEQVLTPPTSNIGILYISLYFCIYPYILLGGTKGRN